MNVIDILFIFLQYSIYIFLFYVIYRKYIRPALVQMQHAENVKESLLSHRATDVLKDGENLKEHINYIAAIFEKIEKNNHAAQEKHKQAQQEAQKAIIVNNKKYLQQQEKIAHVRALREAYMQLKPEVAAGVQEKLRAYYRDNDHGYIKQALSKLHAQALQDRV